LYADVGNKHELHRFWRFFKNSAGFYNSGYLHITSSLMKSDDFAGAEEVWEEWLSLKTLFDIQVPNAMFTCYSKKGLWEKARGICEKDYREWELGAYSFDLLATGYSVGGLMVKAAEKIKKAISCLLTWPTTRLDVLTSTHVNQGGSRILML
jgi:hypothetical protein